MGADFCGGEAEAGDVVDEAGEVLLGGGGELEEGGDGIGHGHEGDAAIRPDKAGVGFVLGGGVEHFGAVVACATARDGEGADEAGEADGAKIEHDGAVGGELFVVLAIVTAE